MKYSDFVCNCFVIFLIYLICKKFFDYFFYMAIFTKNFVSGTISRILQAILQNNFGLLHTPVHFLLELRHISLIHELLLISTHNPYYCAYWMLLQFSVHMLHLVFCVADYFWLSCQYAFW